MSRKQINVRVPESMRMKYYERCDRDGQVYTTTLAIILEKFVDEEYAELWGEEEPEPLEQTLL